MPPEPEQERVEVAELPRVTVVGVSVHVSPFDGMTEKARFTVPVRPPRLVMVILEVWIVPAVAMMLVGEAAIVKSWIV